MQQTVAQTKNVNANLNISPWRGSLWARFVLSNTPPPPHTHMLLPSQSIFYISLSLSLFISLFISFAHTSVVVSRPQRQVILLGQINCTKFLPLFPFPFAVFRPTFCVLRALSFIPCLRLLCALAALIIPTCVGPSTAYSSLCLHFLWAYWPQFAFYLLWFSQVLNVLVTYGQLDGFHLKLNEKILILGKLK